MHKLSLILDGAGAAFILATFALRVFRDRNISAFLASTPSKNEWWLLFIAFMLLAAGLYVGGDFPIVG
jgi:hypothetical protein